MKTEQPDQLISNPKLSLFLLSQNPKPVDPPGMLTPPLQTLASVPFHWEEAPGKPRPCLCTAAESKPKSARSLELPPRLLMEVKLTNSPSPTIVLDGPHMLGCTALSSSLSFRMTHTSGKGEAKERAFGSRRWGSFRKKEELSASGVSFDIAPAIYDRDSLNAEVKITRMKRKKWSLSTLSRRRSHLLASIYESLKQAVPWRRRQDNLTQKGSVID